VSRAPLLRPATRRALARAATGLALAAVIAPLASIGDPGVASADAKRGTFDSGCRVQPPQKFLERRSFVVARILDRKKHDRAMKYLAEHYGNAGDALTSRYSTESAYSHKTTTEFMGLPITVHEAMAPALACVEKYVRRQCGGRSRYTPKAIGGFRTQDTYRDVEVSNHMFGIAIDIDPDRNPCCRCVEPWPNHPLCKLKVSKAEERAALPKCWIAGFERFGFDWLGHDQLEDTMHFEFLGDPDRIKR
jgi:hypothetical protein